MAPGALDALDPRAQLMDTISDKLWAVVRSFLRVDNDDTDLYLDM